MMLSHEHNVNSLRESIGSLAEASGSSACASPNHGFACTEEAHSQQSTSSNIDAAGAPNFECGVCLDVCYDPVVTMCGHLFCWPCLYHWLSLHSACNDCPVCKKPVQQNRVIPLYGHGKVACPEFLADRFPGVRIPCRPSSPTVANASHEPLITSAMTTDGSDPARQHSGRRGLHRNPYNNRVNWHVVLRVSMSGLLPRRLLQQMGLSVQPESRRFNNEKEFVLQWGFILFAMLAILGFLLY
ncbi:hypothetical protein GOP47_0017198 [Adiantum capillus-veneris]|uniref:RING-type E3 ubiquitin transferase n=1 Tax=Adiantum capillus-veneris TaxID=13818 RepID=A0A9D4UK26_ADICA|nr:hypothetical protein GOP47_0017198 [Adiantum capillus-veneris]